MTDEELTGIFRREAKEREDARALEWKKLRLKFEREAIQPLANEDEFPRLIPGSDTVRSGGGDGVPANGGVERPEPPEPLNWTAARLRAYSLRLPVDPGHLAGRTLAPGTLSMIVGPAGIGKTTMALWLGRCIVLGEKFGTMETRKGCVLFLSCELSEQEIAPLAADLFSEKEAEQLAKDLRVRCRPDLKKPGNIEDIPGFLERLREAIELEGFRPDVVLIDALSDIHNLEENSNALMGALLGAIRDEIASPCRCAVGVLHHHGKPSEFRYGSHMARGASRIKDVLATMLTVEWQRPKAEDGPRNVRIAKGRRRKKGQPTEFAFDIVEDDRPGGGLRLEFLPAQPEAEPFDALKAIEHFLLWQPGRRSPQKVVSQALQTDFKRSEKQAEKILAKLPLVEPGSTPSPDHRIYRRLLPGTMNEREVILAGPTS